MSLSLSHLFQLASFAVLLACGQILFKYAATTSGSLNSVSGILSLALNVWFIVAVILYGLATVLWIFILQQVPLSLAYPFVALGFVFVPLASKFLFHEPLNMFYVGGVALIIAGIGVILTLATK